MALRLSDSCLYADLSLSWIRLLNVVSSANFGSFTDGTTEVQSFVYGERRSRIKTHPSGVAVMVHVWEKTLPSLSSCCHSVRNLVIH